MIRRNIQALERFGVGNVVTQRLPLWSCRYVACENFEYLERARRELEGFAVAVEFRHESWFDDELREPMLKLEQDNRYVNVTVDEPQGCKESIPATWEGPSSRLAIIRLHGRHHEKWMAKDLAASSERFNYDCTDDELAELAEPIRSRARTQQRFRGLPKYALESTVHARLAGPRYFWESRSPFVDGAWFRQ